MKHLVLLTLMLLLPVSSGAASYSWTDPAGTVHFTDDLGSVPSKYRAKALRQAAGEETLPDAQPAAAAAPDARPKPDGTAGKTAAPVAEAVTPSTKFGDRSAAEWQQQFQALRGQMKTIEKKFEGLRGETGDGKKLLSKQEITDINARNKQLNEEYEAVRLRYNQMVEQAGKAGLPSEFTQ